MSNGKQQQESINKLLHAFVQEDVGSGAPITEKQITDAAEETLDDKGNLRGIFAIIAKIKPDPKTGFWVYTRDYEVGEDKDAELDEEKIPHLVSLFDTIYRNNPAQFPALLGKFLVRLYKQLQSKYLDQSAAQVQVLLLDRVLKKVETDPSRQTALNRKIRRLINPLPTLKKASPERTEHMQALFEQLEDNKTAFQILPTLENQPPLSNLQSAASKKDYSELWQWVVDFEEMHTSYFELSSKSSETQSINKALFRLTFYNLVFFAMDKQLTSTEFKACAAFMGQKAHREAEIHRESKAIYGRIQSEFSATKVNHFFDTYSKHSVGATFIFGALITITATVLLGLSLTIGIPPMATWAAILGIIATSGAIYSTYYWLNHQQIAHWDYFTSSLAKQRSDHPQHKKNDALAKKHLVPLAKINPGASDIFTLNGIFLILCLGLYGGLIIAGGPVSAGIVGLNSFLYFGANSANSFISMALFAAFTIVLKVAGALFSYAGKLFSDYPGVQARFDDINDMIQTSRKLNQPLLFMNGLGIGTANAAISMLGIAALTASYVSVFAWMAIAISLIAYSTYQLYKGETHLNLMQNPKILELVPSMLRSKAEGMFNMDLENLRFNSGIGLICTVILALAVGGLIANPFTSAATLGLMIIVGFAMGLFKGPALKLMQRARTEAKHEKAVKEGATPLMVLHSKNQSNPAPENKASAVTAETPAENSKPFPTRDYWADYQPTATKKQAIHRNKPGHS